MALTSVIAIAATGVLIEQVAKAPSPQPIVLRMRRVCQSCPNYVIRLTSDGDLSYEGGERTRITGLHERKLDPITTATIIHDFIESGFYDLENEYPSPVHHMTVFISIEMSDTRMSKVVASEDRYGPLLIVELERLFDDLPGMRDLSGWAY